jgi:hypothetical protein
VRTPSSDSVDDEHDPLLVVKWAAENDHTARRERP